MHSSLEHIITVIFVDQISEKKRDWEREHAASMFNSLMPQNFKRQRDFKEFDSNHISNYQASDENAAKNESRAHCQIGVHIRNLLNLLQMHTVCQGYLVSQR
jgi:hypothetical protein